MSEPADTVDHLRNPEKRQACSHPDLADRKPEDLFEAEFVNRYHRLHQDLWWRMIRLHGTLYTLEQLRQFPFDYLYAPGRMEFWRLVVQNFLDMACLMLHGLVNDTGPGVHSIPTFKNEIAKGKGPWLDRAHRDSFSQTLKRSKFHKRIKDIAKRVAQLRHDRIAHRLFDRQSGSFNEDLAGVSFEELRKLFDETHCMFDALSFGSDYETLAGDLTPGSVGGKPPRTCLDEVLDAVLRDSRFVNKPERRSQWWAIDRQHMDPKDLQCMNDLRRRVGLPEA